MSATCQLCTFLLDRRWFAVPVDDVQEVLRFQEMTRVPLAPKAVVGLINLRGRIVPAIDLRTRLELPPRADGCRSMNVVVRTIDGPKALLVDEIGDVYDSPQHHWVAALQGRVDLIPMDEIALNTMLISEGIYLSDRLGREVTAEEVREMSVSTAITL